MTEAPLKTFLDSVHSSAITYTFMSPKASVKQLLEAVAAAQNDPVRAGLVKKLIKRVDEDDGSLDFNYGAYDDLLIFRR